MAMLDELQGWLQAKAAAADQGGVDEAGFDPNFEMPKRKKREEATPFPPSIAGMLSVPPQAAPAQPGVGDQYFGINGEGGSPWGNAPSVAQGGAPADGWGAGAKPVVAPDAMAQATAPPAVAPLPPPVTIGGGKPQAQPGEAYAAAPPMATPRPMPQAPVAAAAPPPEAGFGTKLSSLLGRNSNMLMAMGAGMMGAPTLAQGMSRGFAAAIPASAQDTKQALQQSGIQETYKALVSAGASPADALAAVYNPEVMKQITPRVFGKAMKWGVIGKYPNGTEQYGFIDESNGTVVPGDNVTKPRVKSIEDALRLPKGSHFIDPEGVERVR